MTAPAADQAIDTRDMIVVHTALRREYRLAPGVVQAVEPGDVARAVTVADHVHLINGFLHHHHTGEDRLLWPKLLERVPAEVAPTVELMESQHHNIHRLIDSCETLLASWRNDASQPSRDALAEALAQLHGALGEHLSAEEEQILPLAAQCLSQQEWDQLGEDGMASLEKKHQPLVLGMFMYEGDPLVLAQMLSKAPLIPRVMMPRLAPRTYRRYARRIYGTDKP